MFWILSFVSWKLKHIDTLILIFLHSVSMWVGKSLMVDTRSGIWSQATCLGWTMDPPLWSPDDTGHRSGPCYVGAPPTPGPQPTYYSLSTGTAQTETVFRETAENGNLMRDRSGARTTHPHIWTRFLVELQTKVREYFKITEKIIT